MREIIQIQIGSCGITTGTNFLERIDSEFTENNLPKKGENIRTYFRETETGFWTPRTIITDLDPNMRHDFEERFGNRFRDVELNQVFGNRQAGNNWSKGNRTTGRETIEEVLDSIRRETERCDLMQGFQLNHSLGGGTGSGFTSLIMQKVSDEYPDRIIQNFSIMPSTYVTDVVVEPYNFVLTMEEMMRSGDGVFVIDNQSLYRKCFEIFNMSTPTYSDLNYLVSWGMSDLTTCLRYPDQVNSSMRKLNQFLTPLPKMKFFTLGVGPLRYGPFKYGSSSTLDLVKQLLSQQNMLCEFDPQIGQCLAGFTQFRGKQNLKEISSALEQVTNPDSESTIPWLPRDLKHSFCRKISSSRKIISGNFVGNNTGIRVVFQRMVERFEALFRRKAFLHWYRVEGMEEFEFTEALFQLKSLIADYSEIEGNEEN